MELKDLKTKEEITWCPGCPDFGILGAFQQAILELVSEKKIEKKDLVIVAGIGCHGKIFDYLNLSGFYGLHGRALPVALGIKMANRNLKVIVFAGDGDTYSEGMEHFIHICRYNPDLTLIVHNNQVFALTVGQVTPTSEEGFKGSSTPLGSKERPLNPLVLALESGASFVARGFAVDVFHLKDLIKEAILHEGFSFLDVLQPCIVFHNVIPFLKDNVYKIEPDYDKNNFEEALRKVKEWDYCYDQKKKVPIGIFYQLRKTTFEEKFPHLKIPFYQQKREVNWDKIKEEFIS